MTEDEAKTTRCCGPEGCGFTDSRQDDCQNGERWCIASECMAWRYERHFTNSENQYAETDGRCGLAGKECGVAGSGERKPEWLADNEQ